MTVLLFIYSVVSLSQKITLGLSQLSHLMMICHHTFYMCTQKDHWTIHSAPFFNPPTHTLTPSLRDRAEAHFHWHITACSMHDQPCHYLKAEIIWVSDVSSGSGDYSPCHRLWSSDGYCCGNVKFSPCMKITAVTGEIWPGKWGLWLMIVQISFLKCDVLSQF